MHPLYFGHYLQSTFAFAYAVSMLIVCIAYICITHPVGDVRFKENINITLFALECIGRKSSKQTRKKTRKYT